MMNEYTAFKVQGAATSFFMVFHAILRQILKYRLSAIFSRKLSVHAIF